jgi:hypothetical protein
MVQEPPPNPSEPRSRLEDEVLEILHRTDRPPSNMIKFKSRAQRERMQAVRGITGTVSNLTATSTSLLITCVALAVVAVIISDASPLAGKILALLSIAALFALFFRAWWGPKPPTTKVWRGRDIDLRPPPGQEMWNRLRYRRRR